MCFYSLLLKECLQEHIVVFVHEIPMEVGTKKKKKRIQVVYYLLTLCHVDHLVPAEFREPKAAPQRIIYLCLSPKYQPFLGHSEDLYLLQGV